LTPTLRRTAAAATSVVLLAALAACGDPEPEGGPTPTFSQVPEDESQPSTPTDEASPDPGRAPRVRTLVTGLETPWGLDFLPDGDAIVTERDTRRVLRVGPDGEVTELGTVEQAVPGGEGGLLGVAVPPDFDDDPSVYVYLTSDADNRVLRLPLRGEGLGPAEVVFDGIPNGFIHDGGRIAFGPDGFLYVATGEVGDPELAQDPDSLGGKILRITTDGDPAPGNPTEGSPVWSLGHRNVQGLAWDDEGRLWASEFGDQTWDELNLVEAGNNYGWPEVEGKGGADRFVEPHLTWSTDDASPSGLAHLDGRLWMATLRGTRLWRIDIGPRGRAVDPTAFFAGRFGRLRTVAVAPDSTLWVTTSNRDGRGDPGADDDQILVVTP
jgi:glucose/arabinose dehydrogenase